MSSPDAASGPPARLILVTGPSGAGRSTSIKVLEDLGYEVIDNLPLRFWRRLLAGPPESPLLALGIDARNRDFSVHALTAQLDELNARPELDVSMLYLDCQADVLLRRYSETRRRHPMAPVESPEVGVQRELDLLTPIRDQADTLIDTSELNVHQLREAVERWFAPEGARQLAVSVHSFSYKRGLPHGVDMVFDCRFLTNPYWQPELRPLDGRDPKVAEHVASDTRFVAFYQRVLDMIQMLLPAYNDEGKSHFSIAFGCTGGQHRSVALAEALAAALVDGGQQVSIRHRELERREKG